MPSKISDFEIERVIIECAKEFDLDPKLLINIYETERQTLTQRSRFGIFPELKRLISDAVEVDKIETEKS